MRTAGEVVYADVFLDHMGRSKGCGIVEYENAEDAQNAIKSLNDSKIGTTNRLIFVREDREQKPDFARKKEGERIINNNPVANNNQNNNQQNNNGSNNAGRQIFINGLPYATTEEQLQTHYAAFGTIEKSGILMNHFGKSKGQGFVLYDSAESAQKAILATNNTNFQGRSITVKEDKFA